MANGWLSEAEAVASSSETSKIPNREKDSQQVEVQMTISRVHTKNYNYEFDLVQGCRHRAAMTTHFNTATDLCRQISAGKLSSAELLSDVITQIENFDGPINAVVVRDFERALDRAKAADRKRSQANSGSLGRLHGLPLTVKESFDVSGLATTWGMTPNRDNVASRNAEAVQRLSDAGAIVIGKTNVPNGVADHQTSSSLFGTTNNPWDARLTCGGSSGGSAAALAAGFTSVELGSDLGGSLRVPSHFCGTYSHRPSYGLVPQTGHSLPGRSATTDITAIGPMARSVQDLRLLFDILTGPDKFDAPGWRVDLPKPRAERLSGFRVAVLANHKACEVDEAIESSILNLYIIGRFPEECQREVYEGDPDNLIAGSLAPQGVIERVEGGWRLTGRWQFGSGSDHSPWFILGTRVANPGPGDYHIYHVMVPLADIVLDDTWHTLGMRGTGSKDIVVTNAFIPEHRAVPTWPTFLGLTPHAKSPVYRLSVYSGLPAMLSGSVLGTAEAGLKAFVEATSTRKTPYGVVKAANASMQKRVAESTAEIAAARRLLGDMCDRFDALMAIDQAPMSTQDRIQMRWDAAYVVELSRRAIERLFAASGAHGLYEGNPVYRAFRDINTACHHAVIDFDTVSGMMGQFRLTGDIGENPKAAPFA